MSENNEFDQTGWEQNGLKRLYYWKDLEVHLEV